MINTTKLTKDLTAAREAAKASVDMSDDGGTCNFDGIFFPIGRGKAIGRRSQKVMDAIEAAGCSAFLKDYGIRKGYVVSVCLGGQGNSRTRSAQAVCKALEAQGYEVSMWYRMD